MTNSRFYVLLVFMMDVLTLFKQRSMDFQKGSAVLIGQEKLRTRLFDSLESLRRNNGPVLQSFLDSAECQADIEYRRCLLNDLDDKNIRFRTAADREKTTLTMKRNNVYPPLSEFRELFLTHLRTRMESYFPEGDLSMFEVLEPKSLPIASGGAFTYGTNLMPLARRFDFNDVEMSTEFGKFLEHIIDDHASEYCLHRENDDALQFWTHFMQLPNINWPENFRKLINIVLALPVGSVDAERGFSILTHARYNRRSRLTPQHLDDILFLRINGPSIEKFDALKYTKAWLDARHMETDDPTRRGKTKKSSDNIHHSNLF